jgi:hypothetical protein
MSYLLSCILDELNTIGHLLPHETVKNYGYLACGSRGFVIDAARRIESAIGPYIVIEV